MKSTKKSLLSPEEKSNRSFLLENEVVSASTDVLL